MKKLTPAYLFTRFILEMTVLVVSGRWGWLNGDSTTQYVYALALPVLIAAVWGTFAVPDDPSRSGKAPVPVPGTVRLILELAVFGAGVFFLVDMNYPGAGYVLAAVTLIHYATGIDRIRWLMGQ